MSTPIFIFQSLSTPIFIFVGEDRHCDDTIKVFRTLAGARSAAKAFMDFYGDRYKWREVKIQEWWLFNAVTDIDEGPKVRIELGELDP